MSGFSDSNLQDILLAGEISKVFLDSDAADKLSCEVCKDITEAIERAREKKFAIISVALSGASLELDLSLKDLRKVSSDSRIILLARMYEEPIALKYLESGRNGKSLADDYVIYPVLVEQFYNAIQPERVKKEDKTKAGVVIDFRTAEKIKQLEKLATEDELTGLKNRRYIWEFARQIIERAKRQEGQVTLLIFDIDDFKHYNDIYGHFAGDEILKQAAVLINRCCRGHDVVGRIGGDEFAVVFWGDPRKKLSEKRDERRSAAEHPKEPIFIAERFRRELESTEFNLLGPGGKGLLTISGGLASFPRDGSSAEELFRRADEALLEAKRSGKNRVYLVGKPDSDISKMH